MHRIRFAFASESRRRDHCDPAFFRTILLATAALLAGFLASTATAQQPPPAKLGIPFGFQGARYDEETGLYYFRNRYYDPRTGRFLQRDPKHDPANVGNPYTFVGNSPVSRRDPFGLQQTGPSQPPTGTPAPERPPVSDIAPDIHGNWQGRTRSQHAGWGLGGVWNKGEDAGPERSEPLDDEEDAKKEQVEFDKANPGFEEWIQEMEERERLGLPPPPSEPIDPETQRYIDEQLIPRNDGTHQLMGYPIAVRTIEKSAKIPLLMTDPTKEVAALLPDVRYIIRRGGCVYPGLPWYGNGVESRR